MTDIGERRGLGAALRRWKRLRRAKVFLKYGYLFPKADGKAILADYRAVYDYTQVSVIGLFNLETIAREMVAQGLPGAFVECGTWRGGALAYWARAVRRLGGDMSRHPIYGFDSFEGMPHMTPRDGAATARWLYGSAAKAEGASGELAATGHNVAPIEFARRAMAESGYDPARIHLVKGWFQDSLPPLLDSLGPIAVLRLDADFYESTRFCLAALWDRVIPGGYVVIDDYGTFEGCRLAVDEFLAGPGNRRTLHYVSPGIRYLVK